MTKQLRYDKNGSSYHEYVVKCAQLLTDNATKPSVKKIAQNFQSKSWLRFSVVKGIWKMGTDKRGGNKAKVNLHSKNYKLIPEVYIHKV